jgi:hypothetical protein
MQTISNIFIIYNYSLVIHQADIAHPPPMVATLKLIESHRLVSAAGSVPLPDERCNYSCNAPIVVMIMKMILHCVLYSATEWAVMSPSLSDDKEDVE